MILEPDLNRILNTPGLNIEKDNILQNSHLFQNITNVVLRKITAFAYATGISNSTGSFLSSAVSVSGTIQPVNDDVTVTMVASVSMNLTQSS